MTSGQPTGRPKGEMSWHRSRQSGAQAERGSDVLWYRGTLDKERTPTVGQRLPCDLVTWSASDVPCSCAFKDGIWVSGSSRVKTYGSVEHTLFQIPADWHF